MSLYEYAVAVSDEDAAIYVRGVRAIRGTSFFQGCGCIYKPYQPCRGHLLMQELGERYSLYDEAVAQLLSRPMTGEGESNFSLMLAALKLDYINPVRLKDEVRVLLGTCELTSSQLTWLHLNSGKLIIKANDNEWG